jgi:predicted Zn finger-like uncharacterized protein
MMITRCPACGTVFNVVADQLKVSQGWVRCGQCSDVFDASLHQQEVAAPENNSAPSDAQAGVITAPAPPQQGTDASVSEAGISDDFATSLQAAIEAAAVSKAKNSELPASEPALLTEPKAPVSANGASRALRDNEIEAEESAAAADGVSFVQDARRQSWWKRKWVRAGLAVIAFSLMIALLLQVVIQQKDYLVTQAPRLKPLVQSICGTLGCQLEQLRKIDAVVIDSSTFTKAGADSYKLNFSIRNLGSVAVAMPSLEVTLTDTQDQPMLRKVLLPAQFGAGTALLTPGADFVGSVTLDISATNAQRNGTVFTARVAGYRLLAFYP